MVSRMSEIRYPMKMVAQRTGLSAHVLRVWERRYEAVTPDRTGTNRRLYSEEEVRRLELMAALTRGGHSISQIAKQSTEALEEMARELPEPVTESQNARQSTNGHGDGNGNGNGRSPIDRFLDQAWVAVERMDGAGLEAVLNSATSEIGGSSMIEKVIVPLVARIGEGWDEGEISVAQERVASTVIQEVLLLAGRPHSETRGAPTLVVATPTGQLHELGAALVVCIARRRGWRVTYLGASIPAEEIAHTVTVKEAPAVALSIVYPSDDPGMGAELRRLRQLLPECCSILAGGRASGAYYAALEEIGAKQFASLKGLKDWLDAEREQREPSPSTSREPSGRQSQA
jgi:DNA-binding transcriptional MerR regulator/methylmalonyl-CoA mutase cobalamin-binding subunit